MAARLKAAGALDRSIQFRRATLVDNGLEQVEAWANHGNAIAASRADVSDGERWRANEVQAHITARFLVRSFDFTRGLTPKDRLICDGQEFDISGIKQVGRLDRLEITAAARADK